jgi:hypothetical protein
MVVGMTRERYVAGIVGALVAIGFGFALVPGSLSLPIAFAAAVIAIVVERLVFCGDSNDSDRA